MKSTARGGRLSRNERGETAFQKQQGARRAPMRPLLPLCDRRALDGAQVLVCHYFQMATLLKRRDSTGIEGNLLTSEPWVVPVPRREVDQAWTWQAASC